MTIKLHIGHTLPVKTSTAPANITTLVLFGDSTITSPTTISEQPLTYFKAHTLPEGRNSMIYLLLKFIVLFIETITGELLVGEDEHCACQYTNILTYRCLCKQTLILLVVNVGNIFDFACVHGLSNIMHVHNWPPTLA